MSKVFICSTASAPQQYFNHEDVKSFREKSLADKSGTVPQPSRDIIIDGGANQRIAGSLETPRGVITPISEEDFDWLKNEDAFKRHVKNGFMSVVKEKTNANVAAQSMKDFDGAAPQNVNDKGVKVVDQT